MSFEYQTMTDPQNDDDVPAIETAMPTVNDDVTSTTSSNALTCVTGCRAVQH